MLYGKGLVEKLCNVLKGTLEANAFIRLHGERLLYTKEISIDSWISEAALCKYYHACRKAHIMHANKPLKKVDTEEDKG